MYVTLQNNVYSGDVCNIAKQCLQWWCM